MVQSLTKSLTPEEINKARSLWPKVKEELKKMYLHPSYMPKLISPHIPFNLDDYIQHVSDWKVQVNNEKLQLPLCPTTTSSAFGIRCPRSKNLGIVLCRPTIWRYDIVISEDFYANWPTTEEFKREGDKRIKTGNYTGRRLLPLPRVPKLVVHEFDWPSPNHTIHSEVIEEIEDSMVPVLLNIDLVQQMDNGGYAKFSSL